MPTLVMVRLNHLSSPPSSRMWKTWPSRGEAPDGTLLLLTIRPCKMNIQDTVLDIKDFYSDLLQLF